VIVPISVVLPAYNAEAFLRDALQCVATQTATPAEIIVVDDCSTDGTAALAVQLGARVLALHRNHGPAAARNAGVRVATQPWIAFLDADDLWSHDKLAAQWAALQHWPEAGFCFTDYDVVNPSGVMTLSETASDAGFALLVADDRFGAATRFTPESVSAGLVRSMFIRQSSVVVRRSAFMNCGGYDENLRLAEDYELFLRLTAEVAVVAVEQALVLYKRREDSLSADPLAEVRSIDALWESMLRQPARYRQSLLALVQKARVPTLHRSVARALRLGRFREARALAAKATRMHASPASLFWYLVARAFDSPAGPIVHGTLRTAWRARPSAPLHA
jgi:glycosyltransferase involved in cell wall biosynthesis